jgi:ABC-type multidrug transport system fused ATPase/permease subunit
MSGLGSVGVNIISGLLLYIAIIIFIDTGANLQNMVTSFFVYFFTGVIVANNLIFLPDIASAKIAAINLFEIIDSEDESQMQEKEKSKMLNEGFKPNIIFDKVFFKYESRNHYTLNGLSL